MPDFVVVLTQTTQYTVSIKARNQEAAEEKAQDLYEQFQTASTPSGTGLPKYDDMSEEWNVEVEKS